MSKASRLKTALKKVSYTVACSIKALFEKPLTAWPVWLTWITLIHCIIFSQTAGPYHCWSLNMRYMHMYQSVFQTYKFILNVLELADTCIL